jgi:hypothetical protein
MSKYDPNKQSSKQEKGKYPSYHGSHVSMLVEGKDAKDEKHVICKDDDGMYVTERIRLDNGMADPFRFLTAKLREPLLKEHGHENEKKEEVKV